jgi:hypothetical protein
MFKYLQKFTRFNHVAITMFFTILKVKQIQFLQHDFITSLLIMKHEEMYNDV